VTTRTTVAIALILSFAASGCWGEETKPTIEVVTDVLRTKNVNPELARDLAQQLNIADGDGRAFSSAVRQLPKVDSLATMDAGVVGVARRRGVSETFVRQVVCRSVTHALQPTWHFFVGNNGQIRAQPTGQTDVDTALAQGFATQMQGLAGDQLAAVGDAYMSLTGHSLRFSTPDLSSRNFVLWLKLGTMQRQCISG
jgi:hypothetical protein